MDPLLKEHLIEKLDEVISSPKNKLTKTDLAKLVTIRERIKSSNDKKSLLEILGDIFRFFK